VTRMSHRVHPSPAEVALAVVLALAGAGIAVVSYGRAAEDWRYQLAGLADPFLGRPAPGLSIVVGIILSTILVAVVLASGAVTRRGRR
jgi:hypothetical protein